MKNPFTAIFARFRKKREQKQRLADLRNIALQHAIIQKFYDSGLIHWYERPHALVIEESLARPNLHSREQWLGFLEQLHQWELYQICARFYERTKLDRHRVAINEARKKYVCLSKSDIDRIKRQVEADLQPVTPSQIPGIFSEYDIYIVRAHVQSSAHAVAEENKDGAELLAIAHYDGSTFEAAIFDDVRHRFQPEE